MRLLVLVALILTLGSAVFGTPAQVTVNVDQGYSVCGFSEVQPNVFGMTAYNGAPLPVEPGGPDVLTNAGVQCLGFPGILGWCCPPEKPTDGVVGIENWYKSDEARRLMHDLPLGGDRYEYGQILPACRKIGIEPMVYILSGPSWCTIQPSGFQPIPEDNDLYTALVVGYVGLLREYDPQLKLFHFDNEPNSRYYAKGWDGKRYATQFVHLSKVLKAKYPDIRLGGPVLCWPPAWPPNQKGMPNWYTWDMWTQPFLNIAGDNFDFFDFHTYQGGVLTPSTLEEITLLSCEMRRRWNKSKPIMITEANTTEMTEEQWTDDVQHWNMRTQPWSRFILAMLDQPDKIESVQMHDLMAPAYRVLKYDYTNPASKSPTYWLYWLFRHTRGSRLVVTQKGADGVTAFATRRALSNGTESAVILTNDSAAPREVKATFLANNRPVAAGVSWERMYLDSTQGKVVRDSGTGATVVIPPGGIAVAFTSLSRNVPPVRLTRERVESCGKSVMNKFSGVGSTVSIPIRVVSDFKRSATEARVRIGVLGSETGDEIRLTVNGETHMLQAGTYFQEVKLRKIPTGKQTLTFRLIKGGTFPGLRISCATIVLERRVDGSRL